MTCTQKLITLHICINLWVECRHEFVFQDPPFLHRSSLVIFGDRYRVKNEHRTVGIAIQDGFCTFKSLINQLHPLEYSKLQHQDWTWDNLQTLARTVKGEALPGQLVQSKIMRHVLKGSRLLIDKTLTFTHRSKLNIISFWMDEANKDCNWEALGHLDWTAEISKSLAAPRSNCHSRHSDVLTRETLRLFSVPWHIWPQETWRQDGLHGCWLLGLTVSSHTLLWYHLQCWFGTASGCMLPSHGEACAKMVCRWTT